MLLAVDTSTAQVGLALYDGSQVIGEYAWRSSQRHTVELAPAISELLSRCGLTMEDVQCVGRGAGPRFIYKFACWFVPGEGTCAFASPAIDRHSDAGYSRRGASLCPGFRWSVAIQAGRGRLAVGWYKRSKNGWQAKGPARVVTVEALMDEVKSPVIVCGELTSEERQKLAEKPEIQLVSPAQSVRRPAVLAELAWARWQAGDVDDEATLAPIYLHVAEPIPA